MPAFFRRSFSLKLSPLGKAEVAFVVAAAAAVFARRPRRGHGVSFIGDGSRFILPVVVAVVVAAAIAVVDP